MTEANEYREQRLRHLHELAARGHRPFGSAFERSGPIEQIRGSFEEGRPVHIAGRIVAWRDMGKSLFAHLQDSTGRFQIYLKKDRIGEAAFEDCRHLDLGDFIGVAGTLFTTRTGEPTVNAESWTLLAKALQQPPEKWHGLQDPEAKYRRRYLDLIASPDTCTRFRRRSEIIAWIRAFLIRRGFQEVETPMMQPLAGGASAKPFETYYNALGMNMFLRIAPELYLKRLLIGGFDKVFELNRNFRNEGLDRSHNPEFSMLEVYEAFGDRTTMQKLVVDLITGAAREILGTLTAGSPERPIDLTPPWREATYSDLIAERAGADWKDLDLDGARARVAALGLHADPGWDKLLLGHEIYEKLVEKTLIQPTFVTRLPARLIPLAKTCEDQPEFSDVFELVIDGKEIAPAYTELNDPLEQRRKLLEQVGGDDSALDLDFIEAMEHGMPPAGGMGIGIDRLVMILTGADSIRDVILFPQLKAQDRADARAPGPS
jgi:lysyl-tRNA synthetase class 2